MEADIRGMKGGARLPHPWRRKAEEAERLDVVQLRGGFEKLRGVGEDAPPALSPCPSRHRNRLERRQEAEARLVHLSAEVGDVLLKELVDLGEELRHRGRRGGRAGKATARSRRILQDGRAKLEGRNKSVRAPPVRMTNPLPRLTFQLNITGPEGPASVAIGDLAAVLAQFERALAAYLDLGKVELPESAVVISLLDIRKGSEGLVFSVPAPVMPPVALMSQNIFQSSYASSEAHCQIYRLWEELRVHRWGLAFVPDPVHDIVAAEIPPDRGVPPPPRPSEIKGDTNVLARCLRVGGVKPKAEIRLQSGELLYPDVSEAVAKELGKYLYEEVVVKATATWRTDTWQVIDLQIDSISPFRRVDPVLAFKELAAAAKGRWDEVDAKEYVDRIRGYTRTGNLR